MLETAMLLESVRASMLVSTFMQTSLLESAVLRTSKQALMLKLRRSVVLGQFLLLSVQRAAPLVLDSTVLPMQLRVLWSMLSA